MVVGLCEDQILNKLSDDISGLYLENYVQPELGNTSITVLRGSLVVELVDQGHNVTLTEGQHMQVR